MKFIKKFLIKVYKKILDKFVYYIRLFKIKVLNLIGNRKGINEKKDRSKKIIVSLTSIPSRIQYLHLCIETIMRQSMKPDKIILYLGNNIKDMELPKKIRKLKTRGLEIQYKEDKELKPYTKYFYAMQEYPNDIIITMDDDQLYNRNNYQEFA